MDSNPAAARWVAIVATLFMTSFWIALAWLLARRDLGQSILDATAHRAGAGDVTGYLLLGRLLGRRGLVGAWLADHLGIVFAFRWTGAALACGVMSFPPWWKLDPLSIEAIDRRLEQAASTLGGRALGGCLLTVTLPGRPCPWASRHGARIC